MNTLILLDGSNRSWPVKISVHTLNRVKKLTGVKLSELQSGALFRQFRDPELLINVLWAIIQPDAEKLGVSDIDFGESMADGDTMQLAFDVLIESIINLKWGKEREAYLEIWKKDTAVADNFFTLVQSSATQVDSVAAAGEIYTKAMAGAAATVIQQQNEAVKKVTAGLGQAVQQGADAARSLTRAAGNVIQEADATATAAGKVMGEAIQNASDATIEATQAAGLADPAPAPAG